MKRSIIIAFIILAGVVGWIGSGQITNVVAQDEETDNIPQTTSISTNEEVKQINNDVSFSVETKIFKSKPRLYGSSTNVQNGLTSARLQPRSSSKLLMVDKNLVSNHF